MNKKRGYNWKARKVVETEIDDRATKRIKLDFDIQGNYDQSNALVLPSQKRKTKIKNKTEKVTKILSKKQRKRLEKIVEKKEKKLKRASLLEDLSKVQATSEELKQLTSITSIQTKGLKKVNLEEKSVKNNLIADKSIRINTIKGVKRCPPPKKVYIYDKNDPNIVGSESSSESSDSEDEHDFETNKNNSRNLDNNNEILVKDSKNETVNSEANKEIDTTNGKTEKKEDLITQTSQTKEQESVNMTQLRKPAVFVEVNRTKEIQEERLKLPILSMEQEIMEAISENDVVIIQGETGSGKTTQVPQFLYEAGYAQSSMIGVTEPRRIAAISMSQRVREEMNLTTDEVSYLIRFEGNVTEDTKIKFMTDGVLLKEMRDDLALRRYSVIILDEAHERSVHTDVLIGMLCRLVVCRRKKNFPLKLIIMSATLQTKVFTENKKLFKTVPPVITVKSRQFDVSIHFNRKTEENYLREALKKTATIHAKLPEGGILVFVTGQKEIHYLVSKLRNMFPVKQKAKILQALNESNKKRNFRNFDEKVKNSKRKFKVVPEVDLDDYDDIIEGEMNSENEDDITDEDEDGEFYLNEPCSQPLWVLPLFSYLPSNEQSRVFKPPPEGCRLCVVSTNVAETSLTIPNIKYVVDTGKTKEKLYDKLTGVTTHVVTWTSKASTEQRAGRAGRTGPGHCYRLYSSAVYKDLFKEFSVPEILKKPIDDLYLQMKSMNLHEILKFPFPTPPDLTELLAAGERLEQLGLLDSEKRITELGKIIAKFPVLPRFGKMIAISFQHGLLPYTICIVAALSVQEVLMEVPLGGADTNTNEKWHLKRKKWAGTGNSLLLGDIMIVLRAVGGAEVANSQNKLKEFCKDNGLRLKAILEIRKLRFQLTNEIKKCFPHYDVVVDPNLQPPSNIQINMLRQILLSGMGDRVARKIDVRFINDQNEKRKLKNAYMANHLAEPVFLHCNSVLYNERPQFVIYQEIYEAKKIYIKGITAIEPQWLPMYVSKLCHLSPPLSEPEPWYDVDTGKVQCMVSGTFGRQAWPLPNAAIDYPKQIDAYKLFATFFVEGKVFKKLEIYKSHLLAPPHSIITTWGRPHVRIAKLVNTLHKNDCRMKRTVEEIWETNPKFLLEEYLLWLPDSAHTEVSLFWPPL